MSSQAESKSCLPKSFSFPTLESPALETSEILWENFESLFKDFVLVFFLLCLGFSRQCLTPPLLRGGLQRMLRQIAPSEDVAVHYFTHSGLCRSLLSKSHRKNKVRLPLFFFFFGPNHQKKYPGIG